MLGNAYAFKDFIFVVVDADRNTTIVRSIGNKPGIESIRNITVCGLACVLPHRDHVDQLNDIIFPAGTLFPFDCTLVREFRLNIEDKWMDILGKRIRKISNKYMSFFYTAVSADWGEKTFPPEREILYKKLRKIGKDDFQW